MQQLFEHEGQCSYRWVHCPNVYFHGCGWKGFAKDVVAHAEAAGVCASVRVFKGNLFALNHIGYLFIFQTLVGRQNHFDIILPDRAVPSGHKDVWECPSDLWWRPVFLIFDQGPAKLDSLYFYFSVVRYGDCGLWVFSVLSLAKRKYTEKYKVSLNLEMEFVWCVIGGVLFFFYRRNLPLNQQMG